MADLAASDHFKATVAAQTCSLRQGRITHILESRVRYHNAQLPPHSLDRYSPADERLMNDLLRLCSICGPKGAGGCPHLPEGAINVLGTLVVECILGDYSSTQDWAHRWRHLRSQDHRESYYQWMARVFAATSLAFPKAGESELRERSLAKYIDNLNVHPVRRELKSRRVRTWEEGIAWAERAHKRLAELNPGQYLEKAPLTNSHPFRLLTIPSPPHHPRAERRLPLTSGEPLPARRRDVPTEKAARPQAKRNRPDPPPASSGPLLEVFHGLSPIEVEPIAGPSGLGSPSGPTSPDVKQLEESIMERMNVQRQKDKEQEAKERLAYREEVLSIFKKESEDREKAREQQEIQLIAQTLQEERKRVASLSMNQASPPPPGMGPGSPSLVDSILLGLEEGGPSFASTPRSDRQGTGKPRMETTEVTTTSAPANSRTPPSPSGN